MGGKQNCWEFMQCGREIGGRKESELGTCSAAMDRTCDGLNGGKNGGRICWVIAGTFCDGKVQGTFAEKKLSCMVCEFFKKVEKEEGIGSFKILKSQKKF